MEGGLIKELFILALKQAKEKGDLWWEVRALQELGWHNELNGLVLRNAEEIERSDNLDLKILLADAKDDKQQSIALRKLYARDTHMEL